MIHNVSVVKDSYALCLSVLPQRFSSKAAFRFLPICGRRFMQCPCVITNRDYVSDSLFFVLLASNWDLLWLCFYNYSLHCTEMSPANCSEHPLCVVTDQACLWLTGHAWVHECMSEWAAETTYCASLDTDAQICVNADLMSIEPCLLNTGPL